MNIEELTEKFVNLASKTTLSKSEHEEARKLMKQLKEAGMSNNEVSDLSGGKWSTSTIKFYTPGIKVDNPSPWQDAATLLNKAIAADLTLEDIGNAAEVFDYLEAQSLDLDAVVSFMQNAHSASLSFFDLIQQHLIFKETGVSPYKVAEFLEAKIILEGKGISFDLLKQLSELAGKFGDTQAIFEALSAYGSLQEVELKVNDTEKKLENIHEETESAEQKLQETQDAFAELAKPLGAYKKVLGLGFGEEEMEGLAILADKFGGPKAVFQVLKGYVDYSEINNKVSQAQSELIALESEVNKLNVEYGHMAAAVKMCRTLISDYDFGLDTISAILSAAEKYGDPITVLKAVEAYSKLEVILREIDKQQGIISANKKEIAQLDGKHKNALEKLESLNDLALKVGSEVGRVEGEMSASDVLKKLLMLINEPYAADYNGHINTAILVALSLRRWVIKNETKFVNCNYIKSGLEYLIKEMGGLP